MILDDELRQHVTINTHLGLFRYTHLPSGVAASPAIFQKIIESVIHSLQDVGGIVDDLIITGSNAKKHVLVKIHKIGRNAARWAPRPWEGVPDLNSEPAPLSGLKHTF